MLKKFIIVLVIVYMAIYMCACGGNTNVNFTEGNSIVNSNKTPLKDELYGVTPFSEGLAFICKNKDRDYIYNICINQKGETVFTLSGATDSCVEGFHKGSALVTIDNKHCLVNKKGEIIVSPETHGYTDAFAVEAYKDGYMPVYKENKTFEGTTKEYGVINYSGEWVITLSENPLPTEYIATVQSDLICWNDGTYRDVNDKIIFSVREKYPTFTDGYNFTKNQDCVLVSFQSDGATFFSMLDRNGNLKFEPKEIGKRLNTSTQVLYEDNICWYLDPNGLLTFCDLNGNLKFEISPRVSKNNTVGTYTVQVYYNDGIYAIYESGNNKTHAYYLDNNGNPILG